MKKQLILMFVLFLAGCSSTSTRYFNNNKVALPNNPKLLLYNIYMDSPLLEENAAFSAMQREYLNRIELSLKNAGFKVFSKASLHKLIKANNIDIAKYPYYEELKKIIALSGCNLFLVFTVNHSVEGELDDDNNVLFYLKAYNRELKIKFEFSYSYRGSKSILNSSIIDEITDGMTKKLKEKLN